ncbi:Inositol polyphosphate 5-phosphatase OCRL-1 [Pleurostoma richardsiae]|uniref:Inositol polyphosphate 5-phosphatase OCRL-1 n=1 Tax=Pleurostoma richardsiae TaxID=41990 RepID=A0AA38R4B6_9PEZI|nr:Inositol polyphosphate 5-phosphatase OCRL-1 [Pleurostoma richardsiae]
MSEQAHDSVPPSIESATTEPLDTASSPQSLHRAVYARRSDYTRPHRIRIKIGTWNVAACPGTDKDLARWFISGKGFDKRFGNVAIVDNPVIQRQGASGSSDDDSDSVRFLGGDEIGLYVLGLQEVVNLNPVTQYMYAETNPTEKWKAVLEAALPDGYELVVSEQLSGLLLCIYASPEVAASIGDVSSKAVGTGVMGLLGNKGAVVSRIVLGETTRMVFVNSHLSSGNDLAAWERRCWDAKAIMDRTQFDPVSHAGVMETAPEKIGDEDFVFWFGDLNFRLDGLPGADIRRILMLHTRGEYDLRKKPKDLALDGEGIVVVRSSASSDDQTDESSTTTRSPIKWSDDDESVSLPDPDEFEPDSHDDPASLQATLDSLLPHDQLRRAMRERKAFHDGWHEGPITFLPTYKYDVGTVGLFDSSEKQRAPSWCDRILYRTRKDKEDHDKKVAEEEEARKKDEEMTARGMEHAGDDDEVLFDYDPDNDGESQPPGRPGLDYDEYDETRDAGPEQVLTKEGFTDKINLDIYASHQRITSSDHKPVVSIFTLEYDAVVPELKAKVHAEVARELDRAENEGRPGITIVFDGRDTVDGERPAGIESGDGLVDFGDLRFLEKKMSSLTMANTGRVPATFSFVDKPGLDQDDEDAGVDWLTTSFTRSEMSDVSGEAVDVGRMVTLEPGETVNAVLEAFIGDVSHARVLNDGQSRLEDVLVLRVIDGRDHFIPIRAIWSPTCIGRSIDELIRVPDGGIRKFATERARETGYAGAIPYDLPVHWSAPKELFRLTEALEIMAERVIADEQMLELSQIPRDSPGWPFENFISEARRSQIPRVIDALDNDRAIADAFTPEVASIDRLEAVAEVLLLFLAGLTDGIVTMPLWSRIEQADIPSVNQPSTSRTMSPSEDDKAALLDILSGAPNHNICFVFLATTLSKVVADLSPVSKGEVDALSAAVMPRATLGPLSRRSLSFLRSQAPSPAEASAVLDKRAARERRVAEIFGKVVCRAPRPVRDRERRTLEDKQRAMVELFLRRREDG